MTTKSKRRLVEIGYSAEIARHLASKVKCAPQPCKWFFSDPTESSASRRKWFNANNRYRKDFGCVCDYEAGWVSTTDRSACVPVFAMSIGEKGSNQDYAKNRAVNYLHRAVSLVHVDNPQTLHRATISQTSPLAPHLGKALSSSNTQVITDFAMPSTSIDALFCEEGNNAFSEVLVTTQRRRIFKSTLAQETANGEIVNGITACKASESTILCFDESRVVTVKPKYAKEHEVGGLWWRRSRSVQNGQSSEELDTVLLSLSDSLPVNTLRNL